MTSKHDRHLSRADSSTNWFMFHRAYTLILSKATALFLQDLIDREARSRITNQYRVDNGGRSTVQDDGFFQCTGDYLQDPNQSLVWSDQEQKMHLKVLQNNGYITLLKQGMPATRWVKIHREKIHSDIDKIEDERVPKKTCTKPHQSGCFEPHQSGCFEPLNSNTYGITKETKSFVVNSAAHAASPTDVPTIPKNPERKVSTMREGFGIIPQYSKAVASTFDTTIVERLISLLKKKQVRIQNKRADSVWPKEIAKLRREVSEERISSVFSWYERNAGLKYTPEVLCAKTFRIKFAKLESAMKRSSGGSEPVAISPEDEKIANDIGAWNWPAGLKKELPPFVATVRKQYQTIKAKLTAHITGLEQYSDGRPKDHFAQTIYSLLRSMPSSGGFVKLWVKEVYQKILFAIGKHGEWKGSLIRTHGTLLGSERFETWIVTLTKSETKWQKIKSEVLS